MADKLKISLTSDPSISLSAQYNPETFSMGFESTKTDGTKGSADATAKAKDDPTKKKSAKPPAKENPPKSPEPQSFTKDTKLSFDLIFDNSFTEGGVDVNVPVTFFNQLFYLEGSTVTPKVLIEYGPYINFTGTPESLTLNYLLFNAEGYPVRLKASLSFSGTNANKDKKRTMGNSIEVELDSSASLSSYAAKKLGDAALYTAVAKANKLPNLMKVSAGTKLKIPKI
jgi:nucleoid-associated protein YgaU